MPDFDTSFNDDFEDDSDYSYSYYTYTYTYYSAPSSREYSYETQANQQNDYSDESSDYYTFTTSYET